MTPLTPNRGGRPSKDNPALRIYLLELIRQGGNYTQACQTVGIHPETLRLWCKHDTGFRASIAQTKAMARLQHQRNTRRNPWRVAAAWLERNSPHQWSRTPHLTVADKLRYAELDRSIAPDPKRTPIELDLRIALGLEPGASDRDVQVALEKARTLMRSHMGALPGADHTSHHHNATVE